MAIDRKTSMYPNNGVSGSPEELEAYGVWVKSEPQDLASGFADVSGFTDVSGFSNASFADASNFTGASGFNGMFDDLGLSDADLSTGEAQDFGVGEFSFNSFDDGMADGIGDSGYENFIDQDGKVGQSAQEEMSTQLLMKIADELSSIRTELTSLKKEFTGVRADGGNSGTGKHQGGFFSEEDDDKIALTGDEMENILNSADLSSEESLPFDPLREEDEAALKRLSEQNEAAVNNLSGQDEVEIDFDNLGVLLDSEQNKTGEQSEDALDDLEASGSLDDFPSLDDVDELQSLGLEDVNSLTEDDPFSLSNDGLGDISINENAIDDIGLDETGLSVDINDLAVDSQSSDEIPSLDDVSSLDAASSLDAVASFDAALAFDDTLSLDEMSSLDDMLSLEPPKVSETEDIDIALPAEDEQASTEPDLDNISLDLDDFTMDAEVSAAEDDTVEDDNVEDNNVEYNSVEDGTVEDGSLAQVIPEAFETSTGAETNIPLDDDMEVFADEDLSLDELDKEDSLTAKAEKVNGKDNGFSSEMRDEVKKVLAYMDHLLESLPEEKIEEFAKSEHFDTYKKLFKELGLV
jgi:hypothetical protein